MYYLSVSHTNTLLEKKGMELSDRSHQKILMKKLVNIEGWLKKNQKFMLTISLG